MTERQFAGALAALAVLGAGCSHGASSSSSGGTTPHGELAACTAPSYPAPAAHRPRYTLSLRLKPAEHRVSGRLKVLFTPEIATDRIVFRLWANGGSLASEGAHLATGLVRIDGDAVTSLLPDPTTLVLKRRLVAGRTTAISMPFTLRLPLNARDRISQHGDELRLGSFFPLLGWVPGRGWALEPPSHIPSETSTSPTADFDVRIAAPAGLQVVATGQQVSPGRWHAGAVRDFAVAAGHLLVTGAVTTGQRPVAITIAVARGVPVDADRQAEDVRFLLDRLARLYGPYPWPSFTLAFGPDLAGEGIEYPGLVFMGPDPRGFILPHELAHEWFYGLVGNNQARDPWLDEGLASWAGGEAGGGLAVYTTVPIPSVAAGHLGAPMTYWDRLPEAAYFAGVYAQGVQALESLGPQPKIECALRRYVAANAYGIADDHDLVRALAGVFPQAPAQLARYGVR